MWAKSEGTRRSGSPEYRHLSLRGRFHVVRVRISEFEFACCPYLVSCVVFVDESAAEFDAALTEDVTHRPAVDVSESHSSVIRWRS